MLCGESIASVFMRQFKFTPSLLVFNGLFSLAIAGAMRPQMSLMQRSLPRVQDAFMYDAKASRLEYFGITKRVRGIRKYFVSTTINTWPNHNIVSPYMSMTTISDAPRQQTLEYLSNEERSVYQELYLLSEKIRKLDAAYYSNEATDATSSEVSDEEYDALARKEAVICTTYPHLLSLLETETGLGSKATRFGGRIGREYSTEKDSNQLKSKKTKKSSRSSTKKRIKRQHLTNAPMQSLDNAMDETEAVAWVNRVRKLILSAKQDEIVESSNEIEFPVAIFAEPKIDGLSLSLRYELQNNTKSTNQYIYNFVWAATRGDGSQGEDVTDAVKSAWIKDDIGVDSNLHLYSIPNSIAIDPGDLELSSNTIEIRGEVVLPQHSFKEFSLEVADNPNATSFSNARNAASGILLRSKEPTSQEELERTRKLQSCLRFYAYDVIASSEADNHHIFGSNIDMMRKSLIEYGFEAPSPVMSQTIKMSATHELNSSDISSMFNYHRDIMASRDHNGAESSSTVPKHVPPYQIDGVVYKISDFSNRKICGSSSRTPRWAIAHKFPALSAVTHLLDIDIQVGRTGALTPVAILEPVDLGGVSVSRASLHNFHYARKILNPSGVDKEESKPNTSVRSGISVLVSRAGDVIPQVMKRVFDDTAEDAIDVLNDESEVKLINLDPPSNCPACGSPTTFEFMTTPSQRKNKTKEKSEECQDEDNIDRNSLRNLDISNTESGQVLRCSGPQLLCRPRAINAMTYAYSRTGLDVKGLSKARLQQLIDQNIIRFPADLFSALEGKEQVTREETLQKIADLPGWGALSSENLASSIDSVASKGVSLSRFIYSLGIPFIGTQASQLVASSYKTSDAFLSALEDAANFEESNTGDKQHPFVLLTGDNESEKVRGIGPVALSSLLAYSKEKVLVDAAKDLANALTVHNEDLNQSTIPASINSPFKDMTVVFTGTLPISRTAAQTAVKSQGAKSTPNTISKSTDLVVVGDKGGKKAKQAEELGVQVMDADKFMKLIS